MALTTLQSFDSSKDEFETWVLSFDSYLIANGIDKTEKAIADKSRAILISSLGLPKVALVSSSSYHVKDGG
jgi:hypothetical protein